MRRSEVWQTVCQNRADLTIYWLFRFPADTAESDQWLSQTASADVLDTCIVTRYNTPVIKSFRHNGVESFFLNGTKARIRSTHAAKLARQLQRLDVARGPQDMNVPGWKLHPPRGNLKGPWSVWVGGNWRLTFAFEGDDAILVDYQDYH